jgi:hypothetical protein
MGMFIRIFALTVLLAGLVAQPALAQDTKTVLANASKAMGADNVTSVTLVGSGANYNLGQSNNAVGPWPRVNLNDYRRTIDLSQPALRASAVTWAAPPQGTPAVQAAFNQSITPANAAWRSSWRSGRRRGLPERRGGQQRHHAHARTSSAAAPRRHLNAPVQVAGGALPRRRLINAANNYVDGGTWLEPGFRRHARQVRVTAGGRARTASCSRRRSSEPRRLADLRRADPER